jgi:hypothetical protein
VAERECRRADAELRIVVPVDHGVFGVVGERVAHVCREEQPAFRREALLDRGVGHRDAEAEGDAEVGLRQ